MYASIVVLSFDFIYILWICTLYLGIPMGCIALARAELGSSCCDRICIDMWLVRWMCFLCKSTSSRCLTHRHVVRFFQATHALFGNLLAVSCPAAVVFRFPLDHAGSLVFVVMGPLWQADVCGFLCSCRTSWLVFFVYMLLLTPDRGQIFGTPLLMYCQLWIHG